MIKGLFETHVLVTDLEASRLFYERIGLPFAHRVQERRVDFFWIGKPGQAMLGVWEVPKDQWVSRHFAFEVEREDMKNAVAFLKEKGLALRSFSKDGTEDLEVAAWMPAVAIFFRDLDGNSLEFISMLPDEPRPELGVVKYAEWEAMHNRA
ncbi:VOC family protein [Brevibacillus fluminis]|uniref:VOC family protein n=1 Tax=Brevibacillus fluminis TaxID=511487 RepID=UPI003F8975F9